VAFSEGVNGVNRREKRYARHNEERDADGTHAASGGTDLTRARTLFARVARERGREPGLYVAIAVVHADRREEQFQRWDWRGEADALRAVGEACGRLEPVSRGLRVRVHRAGGDLVGSALLRREALVERRSSPRPSQSSQADLERTQPGTDATAATMCAALDAQQHEIASLRRALAAQERRLAEVAAVAERVDEVEAHLAALLEEVAAWAEAS
jgi:hypothetical protein